MYMFCVCAIRMIGVSVCNQGSNEKFLKMRM
nr:MAG TPA: hypothetical protein [Caudoviricetes sp.]